MVLVITPHYVLIGIAETALILTRSGFFLISRNLVETLAD